LDSDQAVITQRKSLLNSTAQFRAELRRFYLIGAGARQKDCNRWPGC
jgi:hypothetical protein